MVNVIGLGYIGLPTALMLASHGVAVIGTNHSRSKIDTLRAGKTTFQEEGLDALFQAALDGGIVFLTECAVADTYIVSVQTPYDPDTKKVDMQYVNAAVGDVLKVAPKGAVIVIESTISPGAIDRYVRPYIAARGFTVGADVHLAHAPERIIPGNMIHELKHNNRTVGADRPEIAARVAALYASFCDGEIVRTDIRTAEMTKVVENTFRAVNIAFANELAKICRRDGLDVHEVRRICNMHPRVNILSPGPGVGGHCIPVDPWFLVGDYPDLAKVIEASLRVNASMPAYVLERIQAIMVERGITDPARVGLYGLTFKENVDDMRDSPAMQLLALEPDFTGRMQVYDPYVTREVGAVRHDDLASFLTASDLVVILVKHDQLRAHMEDLRG